MFNILPAILRDGRFGFTGSVFFFVSIIQTIIYAGSGANSTQFYDSVITTGDKSLSIARKQEMAFPASLEVITLTESDKEHNISCADILSNKISGLTIKSQGGIGSFADVSIRGASAGRVGVYLDDIPLNSGNGTVFNINSLSSALVNRIEVYKGNVPAGFGVNGTGGIIKLVTDNGVYGNDVIAGLGGGFYGYGLATCQYNGSFPKTRVYASGEFMTSENDFKYHNSNGTAYNTNDDFTGTQNNDYSRHLNLLTGASHVLPNFGVLSGMLFYNEGRKGLPGLPSVPNHTAFYYNKDLSGQLFYKSAPMSAITARSGLVFKNNSYTTYYPVNELNLKSRYDVYRKDQERLVKVQSEGSVNTLPNQNLSLFGDASYEDFLPHDLTNNEMLDAFDASRYALTGGLRYSLAGNISETVFSGSTQYAASKHSGGINRNTEETIPPLNNDNFYYSGGFSSLYKLSQDIKFYTSVNYLIQQPSLYQLFGDKGTSLPNVHLKPEKSINSELGVRYNLTPRTVSLSGNTVVFANSLKDAMVIQKSFAQVMWINNSRALVYGIESDANLKWRDIDLSASVTLQEPMNKTRTTNSVDFYNKMLPGQNKVKFFSEAIWSPSRFVNLLYCFKFESNYFNDFINSDPVFMVPSKTIHDVGLSLFPLRKWRIDVTFDNITDANEYDVYGFPTPGRMFYIKTMYKISLKSQKESR